MSPGQSGIFDFIRHDKETHRGRIQILGGKRNNTIFEILSSYGYRVGVFNLPGTYPPCRINGAMITGFLTPSTSSDYTYPKQLKEIIRRRFGEYQFKIDYRRYSNPRLFVKDLRRLLDLRLNVLLYLIEEYDFDFLIAVFTCTDTLQHYLWKYIDKTHPEYSNRYENILRSFWKHLDDCIKTLIEAFDYDDLIILSDHGFTSQKEIFNVNTFLLRKGYLALKENYFFYSALRIIDPFSNLISRRYFRRLLPYKKIKSARALVGLGLSSDFDSYIDKIDWKRTKAYSPNHTSIYGAIYIINDYYKCRNRLTEDLKSLALKKENASRYIAKNKSIADEILAMPRI